MMQCGHRRAAGLLALVVSIAPGLCALDPSRSITQYIHRVWTQEDGLPQDAVRAIAQTPDGYLWIGTDEGLARFDGYDFARFDRRGGALPNNSVTALAVAADGTLWIGTQGGLVSYKQGRFRTYAQADGLAEPAVYSMAPAAQRPAPDVAAKDANDGVWVASGGALYRVEADHVRAAAFEPVAARENVRVVQAGPDGALWVGGYNGVFRVQAETASPVLSAKELGGQVPVSLWIDADKTAWAGISTGLLEARAGGGLARRFTTQDGLPASLVRAIWRDRDGVLWAGTNSGIARFEPGLAERSSRPPSPAAHAASVPRLGGVSLPVRSRFVRANPSEETEQDWVRAIYEDREGSLWIGTNNGLECYYDGRFTLFSRLEGMPGNKPTVVHESRDGSVWVGFHDRGLFRFRPAPNLRYAEAQGLPSNEIFSLRDTRDGGLLIATREGAALLKDGVFHRLSVPDPGGRNVVFDVLEDRSGGIWAAGPGGLIRIENGRGVHVAGGGKFIGDVVVSLAETPDGSIWAASSRAGLWEVRGAEVRHYGPNEGLPAEQIRSIQAGRDGTLWLATFGAGLVWREHERFRRCGLAEGLSSDNIASIEEDAAGDLWMSTTRGIVHVTRASLTQFASGHSTRVRAEVLGLSDGLRSTQCALSYPSGGGSECSRDGWLWFPTGQGLALLHPDTPLAPRVPPAIRIVSAEFDGKPVDVHSDVEMGPGEGRVSIHYSGIFLRAPESVQYSSRLDPVERDFVAAGPRRLSSYSNLSPGKYLFRVRASAGGALAESVFPFTIRPHFYQTIWFAAVCAFALGGLAWGAWQLRVQTLSARFRLVLEERARLARELHDTLAQDFVGLSALLDAVAMRLQAGPEEARRQLDLARKMVRHSLTEARRSVMDLRSAVLQGQSLSEALSSAAPLWLAGSPLKVHVQVTGEPVALREEVEQHMLRIAQEALHNVAHHARAHSAAVHLDYGAEAVTLTIQDDGQGFDPRDAFQLSNGRFGILGMQERAERAGGTLRLESAPQQGTTVEIRIPLRTGAAPSEERTSRQ